MNLLPDLMGERDDAPHTELFWRSGQNHAARVGNYKLVRFGSEFDQLFDLAADIGGWYDSAATRARWDSEVMDPRWRSVRTGRMRKLGGQLKTDNRPDLEAYRKGRKGRLLRIQAACPPGYSADYRPCRGDVRRSSGSSPRLHGT